MTNDSIREFCLSLPMTTEEVQWEEHLLFKIGGKMFAITQFGATRCSLKATPERYAELVELPDVEPSSHNMWKYNWVNFEKLTAVTDSEFRELLKQSYELVRGSLSKKFQSELDAGRQPKVKKWVPKAEREKDANKSVKKLEKTAKTAPKRSKKRKK